MTSHTSLVLPSQQTVLQAEEKGFTLIELLVVVIIIGVLAAISFPLNLGVQKEAHDSPVKSDVVNAKSAVVAYATDENGMLPADLTSANLASKYGYIASTSAGNYAPPSGVSPVLSKGTSPSTGSCIYAVSVTDSEVRASNIFGVATSASTAYSAAGVLTQ